MISIHALREEGDLSSTALKRMQSNFYPRPPRGGRLSVLDASMTIRLFLSTPSARRATAVLLCWRYNLHISIHALREEGDYHFFWGNTTPKEFLSTPSARRATEQMQRWAQLIRISIHALREEGDQSPQGLHDGL